MLETGYLLCKRSCPSRNFNAAWLPYRLFGELEGRPYMKRFSIALYPPITSSLTSSQISKHWTSSMLLHQFPELPQTDRQAGSSRRQTSPCSILMQLFSRNQRYGSVTAVCRSHEGLFLGASFMVFGGIRDALTLEALAVREALALADDLNLHHIHVASDCKVVVDDINQSNMATYGAILNEIIEHNSSFDSCNFVHEFMSLNVEAHNLAKHALKWGAGRHVWLGHPGNLSFLPVNLVTVE
uniref:RNase H type-1 domain-containing protein n=1 Tax=Hordeum vulgare subsp. vulgare TaxID=112509 RepID=A0A8I6YAR1_HORVV